MDRTLTLTLVAAAVSLGSIHTLAPDHWVPFAALAGSERWSSRRAAAVTAACGLGHVTGSVALGLLGLLFGLELLQTFGQRMESISGLLLIGFGVAYGAWGLNRSVRARAHARAHAHGHVHAHLHAVVSRQSSVVSHESPVRSHQSPATSHHDLHRPLTAWTLFLLFSADPCVAVIPLLFAAAPLGWPSIAAVVLSYEIATIGTMVALVLPARAAAQTIQGAWVDRWGDAVAGGVVAGIGVVVMALGI
jgi:ABC-type nickel/cobalt efflux system permease component RcnA